MANIQVFVQGLDNIEAAVLQLQSSTFAGRLFGPSLRAAAGVVAQRAKQRDYGFTDRTGYLRRSIRARRIAARYFDRRVRGGRAAVFAGRPRPRSAQALLVEYGHGGPKPARPHPYLNRALAETIGQQQDAFAQRAQELFPRLLERFNNLGTPRNLALGARSRRVSLRGRRR